MDVWHHLMCAFECLHGMFGGEWLCGCKLETNKEVAYRSQESTPQPREGKLEWVTCGL